METLDWTERLLEVPVTYIAIAFGTLRHAIATAESVGRFPILPAVAVGAAGVAVLSRIANSVAARSGAERVAGAITGVGAIGEAVAVVVQPITADSHFRGRRGATVTGA